MLLVLIAAVASTAVLVLAITGSFDGAGSDDGAVPALAVPGVRTDGGPEEGAHVASGTPVPVGLRTDGGPEEGTRGSAGAASQSAITRIGVRGVPLPAAQ